MLSMAITARSSNPQATLAALQPRRRERVYDLVQQVGLDVEDWANYKKPNAPAANPKYCYEWSFTQDDRLVVLNLWHASFMIDGHSLACDLNMRAEASEIERAQDEPWRDKKPKPVWAKRARAMDRALQVAWRCKLLVRVIVCEGTMRDLAAGDEESSKVKLRALDPVPWTLVEYDWESGRARLRRLSEAVAEFQRTASTPPDHSLSQKPVATGALEHNPPESQDISDTVPEWAADDESMWAELDAVDLSETERLAVVRTRINQSGFRQRLLERWDGRCSVTGLAHADFLVASHIVPWSRCTTPKDRWSPDNGLLLPPGLDKAFEVGLIGFDAKGKVILSKRAERLDIQSVLGISRTHAIRNFHLHPGLSRYLEQHRSIHQSTLAGRP